MAAPSLRAQSSGDTDGPGEVEPYGGQEVEYHSVIQAFSGSELKLEDGTTFIVDGRTVIETLPDAGQDVEVEAIDSDGGLLAVEIEKDDFD